MKYALLGEKLSHSYSAEIHSKFGYQYELVELALDAIHDKLSDRQYSGYNVTVPYKEAVIPYLDELDASVGRIGACNTIVRKAGRLIGYNTDYLGLKQLIQEKNIDYSAGIVAILGSGGTSKTALAVVADLGGQAIIISRKGEINYDNIYDYADSIKAIINTTPHGMYPNISHISMVDLDRLPKVTSVIDVVFNPKRTALLYEAQRRGITSSDGLKMLIYQAMVASKLFLTGEYGECDTTLCESIYQELQKKHRSIILIGMPSSGKTTIAEIMASTLGNKMIDSDRMIEDREGISVCDIINKKGIDYFRKVESMIIKELASYQGSVIASGGGSILAGENRYYLSANSIIVYIKRSVELLSGSGRPLSHSPMAIRQLYDERAAIYESLADYTLINDGGRQQLQSNIKELLGVIYE